MSFMRLLRYAVGWFRYQSAFRDSRVRVRPVAVRARNH